mgnify:CR=1 FL=1
MKALYNKSFVFLALVGLMLSQAATAGDIFGTDLDAAKKQAAAEKKDLAILFTGSAWCQYCIKLNDKVWSQADFQNDAPKDFVFVKIDFPKEVNKAPAANLKLAMEYSVASFPTVIVADETGKTLAQTEYFHGINDKVFLGHLKVLKSDAATAKQKFADAETAATDADKIKLLAEGIEILTDNKASLLSVREQVKKIVLLDKAGKAMFGAAPYKAVYFQATSSYVSKLARAGNFAEGHKEVDALLTDIPMDAEEKQAILFALKGGLYAAEGNVPKAIETYKEAIKLAPTSKLVPQIEEYIKALEKTQSDIIDVN